MYNPRLRFFWKDRMVSYSAHSSKKSCYSFKFQEKSEGKSIKCSIAKTTWTMPSTTVRKIHHEGGWREANTAQYTVVLKLRTSTLKN